MLPGEVKSDKSIGQRPFLASGGAVYPELAPIPPIVLHCGSLIIPRLLRLVRHSKPRRGRRNTMRPDDLTLDAVPHHLS